MAKATVERVVDEPTITVDEAALAVVTEEEQAPPEHTHAFRTYTWGGEDYRVERPSAAGVLRLISVLSKGFKLLKDTPVLDGSFRERVSEKRTAERRQVVLDVIFEVASKLTAESPDIMAELVAVLLGQPTAKGWAILEAMPPEDLFDVLADAVYAYPMEDILDHFFRALDELGKRNLGTMLNRIMSKHTR